MRRVFLAALLLGLLPVPAASTAHRALQQGEVPARQRIERQDQCHLMYYNLCSGWTWLWDAYCRGVLWGCAPQYGTCFDLTGCPGECRHLEDVWWAARAFGRYCYVDIEIYCADENACPVGAPLAGIYDIWMYYGWRWYRFDFGGPSLCQCEAAGGKFIVMVSHIGPYYDIQPYSDANHRNIQAGCESDWRCSTHSYVYRNVVSYCDVYGAPGPLWVDGPDYGCTNFPPIPPGCHDYYWNTGYSAEWLIDCYVSCQGPTQTEKTSWSGVKAMYR